MNTENSVNTEGLIQVKKDFLLQSIATFNKECEQLGFKDKMIWIKNDGITNSMVTVESSIKETVENLNRIYGDHIFSHDYDLLSELSKLDLGFEISKEYAFSMSTYKSKKYPIVCKKVFLHEEFIDRTCKMVFYYI